ncbi:MAG: dihydrofolate reductase family protein [Nitrososphaeraceae archaeon]
MLIFSVNALPKIVLSKTLEKAEWNNSRLISENIKEEVLNIKQQPGKDLVLFGGADIASNLLQLGLIDEYRIILNPVVLSNGKPFFKNTKDKLSLNLLKTRTFSCGNVILYYQPIASYNRWFIYWEEEVSKMNQDIFRKIVLIAIILVSPSYVIIYYNIYSAQSNCQL